MILRHLVTGSFRVVAAVTERIRQEDAEDSTGGNPQGDFDP
jgi:hypothetical protein